MAVRPAAKASKGKTDGRGLQELSSPKDLNELSASHDPRDERDPAADLQQAAADDALLSSDAVDPASSAAAAREIANLTPMMRQYLETKAQNPDAILFFRLGYFYEMFF